MMRAEDYSLIDPFGKAECEEELEQMHERYEEIFFDETPFNAPAISELAYLIVGRRGSGKTALSQFFSFQKRISNARCLDADEPTIYNSVLAHLSSSPASESRQLVIPHLIKVWEMVVWITIFRFLQHEHPAIQQAVEPQSKSRRKLSLNSMFEYLQGLIVPGNRPLTEENLDGIQQDARFEAAKSAVYAICSEQPLIVAIDTVEQYDVNNESMMNAVAGLIEFASKFHSRNNHRGIHIKVFVSGEVFPFLKEGVLLNTLKSVKHPVYLLWRPKDLLRLICWRLYKKLEASDMLLPESETVKDWENSREIYRKVWLPYFGKTVVNQRGDKEDTFAYMLRHTQMRPRQLIVLCNAVANLAIRDGKFPRFHEAHIREGVREAESELATEILNAYASVYPGAGQIVDALLGCSNIFSASELDKRAKETAAHWPRGHYSPHSFKRLVTELGIVGRVKRRNDSSGYIDAEFEYSSRDRLALLVRDECVVHPMFYRKLKVAVQQGTKVMPFSTDREMHDVSMDFY